MRLFILSLLVLSSWSVAGQTATTTSTEYAYCEMRAEVIPFSNLCQLYIDLGERRIDAFGNNIVVREADSNKRIEFRSRIDALRFMRARGWELVEVFTVGDSSAPVYLLRFPLKGWEEKAFIDAEAKALFGEERGS